jgi:hypothetical protein
VLKGSYIYRQLRCHRLRTQVLSTQVGTYVPFISGLATHLLVVAINLMYHRTLGAFPLIMKLHIFIVNLSISSTYPTPSIGVGNKFRYLLQGHSNQHITATNQQIASVAASRRCKPLSDLVVPYTLTTC